MLNHVRCIFIFSSAHQLQDGPVEPCRVRLFGFLSLLAAVAWPVAAGRDSLEDFFRDFGGCLSCFWMFFWDDLLVFKDFFNVCLMNLTMFDALMICLIVFDSL